MKKILTVSVLAMMAVTAANAEIASKAYVDQQIGDINANDVATAIANAITDTYSASDSAHAMSGVAVASAITNAGGQTAQQVSDAISTALANSGDAYQTASDVTTTLGDYYTETEADAKFQTLDNLATSSTWSTDKSSDTKYASAKAVDAAITAAGGQTAQQVSDAIDTKVGTLDDTSGAAQAGKWVTAVTQTDGKITATMADPLAAFTKLGQNAGDGVYALTATATDGNITGYKWELIQRAQ